MPHVHAPGLVLQLDPQALCTQAATFAGAADVELSAQQYFVCIDSNAKDALWVPLFAGPGPGRKGIAASAKTGNARWTRCSSFYDAGLLLRVAHKATQRAAEAAYDNSTPKAPNLLATAQLPQRAEFPADVAFRPMAGIVSIR